MIKMVERISFEEIKILFIAKGCVNIINITPRSENILWVMSVYNFSIQFPILISTKNVRPSIVVPFEDGINFLKMMIDPKMRQRRFISYRRSAESKNLSTDEEHN